MGTAGEFFEIFVFHDVVTDAVLDTERQEFLQLGNA